MRGANKDIPLAVDLALCLFRVDQYSEPKRVIPGSNTDWNHKIYRPWRKPRSRLTKSAVKHL